MSSSNSSAADSPVGISRTTTPTSAEDLSETEQILKSVNRTKWRPLYHFMSPNGWMNDPCAPTYDRSTGMYHVYYQCNFKSHDWADISWGQATSHDLVSWKLSEQPALSPDQPYDLKGVFTGCMLPTSDGTLACAYTSVSQLPVHHTLPHPKGSESLSIAKSFNHGRTWEKLASNPVLPCEPEDLDVTGWRDPFVAEWPCMCQVLGRDPATTLFGIISGGIRNRTPTTFLYAVSRAHLEQWEYVCPLIDFGLNLRPSRWSGDLGKNWEVTNFITLRDENDPSVERDFLVMGTEGCINTSSDNTTPTQPTRPARSQLWMSGPLKAKQDRKVQMSFAFGGHLDHGLLYAANSFFDPKTDKTIVWGWIGEDDLCDDLRAKQGWSGMLSLPREVRIQTLSRVIGALRSPLATITSLECEDDGHGSSTVRTLGLLPVESVIQSLRKGARIRRAHLTRPFGFSMSLDPAFTEMDIKSSQFELDCSFQVSRLCSRIGVVFAHSKDPRTKTTLCFRPSQETFYVERPSLLSSRSASWINSETETAPHTLFTQRDIATGAVHTEPLRIRIWRDNSALEVFLNGRTAISTRLYAAEHTFSISFFAQDDLNPFHAHESHGSAGPSELLNATLYDGIGKEAEFQIS